MEVNMNVFFRKLNDRTKPIHIPVIKSELGFRTVQKVFGFHKSFIDEVAEDQLSPLLLT